MLSEFDTILNIRHAETKYPLLDELVERLNHSNISSIRSSVLSIVRVIREPHVPIRELSDIIHIDPPLAARVLKTANSAFYSRSFTQSFSDIEQAAIWIGTDTIKELALSQKVCEIFDREEKIGEYSRKALWRHSIAVAITAKQIFRKEFGLKGEDAYIAGLLHDIGVIAEDQFLQGEFKKALSMSNSQNIDISLAEKDTWGFDHAEVGSAIISSWGLAEDLCAAVEYHNQPIHAPSQFVQIVFTLFVSDYLCQMNGFTFGADRVRNDELFNHCIQKLNISAIALDLILKATLDETKIMQDKGLM